MIIICLCSIVIFFLYLLTLIASIAFNKDLHPNIALETKKVSVVVALHNESHQIRRLLKGLMGQNYKIFEIILVNDSSDDNTLKLIKEYSQGNPNIKIIDLTDEGHQGKKRALDRGIEEASYEYIILTDGDCEPASDQWLANMASQFDENHQVIGGYAPFYEEKSLVNIWSRFENVYTALQYFGLGYIGFPYMSTGRNLGYSKKLFDALQPLKRNFDLMAGDDDLTVQLLLKNTTMKFVLEPQTFMFSQAPDSWKNYFRQKLRHYSVSTRYPKAILLILTLFFLSWITFWVTSFILLFVGLIQISILLIIIKLAVSALMFRFSAKRYFHQTFNIWSLLALDLLFPFAMTGIVIFTLFKPSNTWK